MQIRSGWQQFLALFQNTSIQIGKPEVKATGLKHMRPEITVKNMFAAASYQFTKSVGKNTLHPVPSIDETDNVKPFQLVIKSKKRKFVIFEKAVFRPTEFQLTDVMIDNEAFKTKAVECPLMSEYNRTTKLSLKGKFGAEISKEILDAELEATDTISLAIKFGRVMKWEVNEPELLTELSAKNINMDHPYIRQIRQDSRKSLCLITGVTVLPDGGTIHRVSELDTDASLKASFVKGAAASTGSTYSKDRDIGLAPNTPIAFNIHELNVDKKTGAMQLVLAKGSHGGFKDCIGYDEVDAQCIGSDRPDQGYQNRRQIEIDLGHPKKIFSPLFDLSPVDRSQLNGWLLQLMAIPRDMVVLSDLLDDVERGQQIQVKIADLKEKFLSVDNVWLEILRFVEFQVKDSSLCHPEALSDKLHALGEFLDAATMLDDDMLDLLREMPARAAEPMLQVLHEGIKGLAVKDPQIVKSLLGNSACLKILLDLQFRIQDDIFEAPVDLIYTIDEVYWVIFALYGNH